MKIAADIRPARSHRAGRCAGCPRGHDCCPAKRFQMIYTDQELRMAMQVRTSGCMYSIIASVVLTIVLNVLLRACSGGTAGW